MNRLKQEDSYRRLPIQIVTGFLGSGKTTLLNRLLRQPEMQRTAVIVNEFGEIGVDHLLVQASTEDIVLLEGGCLCCAVRGDLLRGLQKLYEQREQGQIPPFEQVLIETTGLADPAPILRTLLDDGFVAAHYRLDAVVTTVDAVYAMQQLGEYDESVKQVALARHLILTKTDLAAPEQIARLRERLRLLNPTAGLHDAQHDRLDRALLFHGQEYADSRLDAERWLQADAYLHPPEGDPPEAHRHDAYLRTFCIERSEPLSWLVLERWIRQLTRLRGKDLLRVKGIAHTCETDLPVVIQGVQHIFQPPATLDAWPPGPKRSRIVFITRNLGREVVEQSLEALRRSRNPAEVCQAALILLGQVSL